MYSSSRNKAKVRLLAVHTTEGILNAADLRAFFNRPTAEGSSHASADADGVLLEGAKDGFVDYDKSAWTLRNGNPISDNIELCGFAKWKRPDWLARPKMLDRCAWWLAQRAAARGIPLVKLSPKEVAAGRAGVIGHNDWTVGMKDGTHWDPGPDFPWDVVLSKAAAYAAGQHPEPQPLPSEEDDIMKSFRSDPATGGNGQIVIGAEGIWEPIPSPAHYGMLVTHELIKPFLNVSPPVFDYYGAIYLSARKDSSAPVVHGLMAPVSKVAEAARNVTEEEARAAITDPALLAEVDRLTAEAA